MTNQEKKDYMQTYLFLSQELDRELEELTMWRSRATKMTSNSISDMPRGGFPQDRVQSAVEVICEIEDKINFKIGQLSVLKHEIELSINGVEDQTLRSLLRYRYINGLTWEQIAERMNYNYRWVLRLHRKALAQLAIESHTTSMLS